MWEEIIFIGDLHFKRNNNKETDIIISETLDILKKYSNEECKFNDKILCVFAGDLLHEHERLYTSPLNKITNFIDNITNYCEIIILVGNHDYENNRQYFTTNHWMNSLKKWPNVKIVDKVYCKNNIVFMPYVPPGMFVEGLNELKDFDWKMSKYIFAHQEFKGCNLGIQTSKNGDFWDINWPMVISGHIHKPHMPQKNIIYPGSVIQHTFGEEQNNTGILSIDLITNKFSHININIPGYRTVKVNSENIEDYLKNLKISELEHLRIILECNLSEIKLIKSQKFYKDLSPNIKIIFSQLQDEDFPFEKNEIYKDFMIILEENINTEQKNILSKILTNKQITFLDL